MAYRGHDDWRDMSDYAVHFTKPIPDTEIGDPPPPPERKDRLRLGELVAEVEKPFRPVVATTAAGG